ncbi:hypothetical protein GCM10023317_64030 [Actinopolymorpha pittospori]
MADVGFQLRPPVPTPLELPATDGAWLCNDQAIVSEAMPQALQGKKPPVRHEGLMNPQHEIDGTQPQVKAQTTAEIRDRRAASHHLDQSTHTRLPRRRPVEVCPPRPHPRSPHAADHAASATGAPIQ